MNPEDMSGSSGDIEATPSDARATDDEHSGLSRRKLLAAAAMGTAAGSLLSTRGGLGLGGLAAAQSAPNCNAGDIDASGGFAVNEPCACTGTFGPVFEFLVANQNNANRTCITLLLGTTTSTDPVCQQLAGSKILLRISPGQPGAGNSFISERSVQRMRGTPVDENGDPILIDCATFTQCCFDNSIIAFRTAQNQQVVNCPPEFEDGMDIGDFPPSQCRRLQICLTGFGIDIACADANCVERSLTNGCCSVPCGQSLRVKVTASGSAAPGPNQEPCPPTASPTISVRRPGETTFTNVTLVNGCYVDASPVAGSYTIRATDCNGCFREATLAVCVEEIVKPTVVAGTPNCLGVTTFTVSPCPPAAGVSYSLVQVACASPNAPVVPPTITNVTYNATSCTFTATLPQGQTTCVRVRASNANPACDQLSDVVTVVVPAAITITAPVQSNNPCSGVVTFNPGTVSGGVGPFTFAFSLDGGAFVNGTTFVYNPTLVAAGGINTACHSLRVRVTDANGCTATSPALTFTQCVNTTTGCTP